MKATARAANKRVGPALGVIRRGEAESVDAPAAPAPGKSAHGVLHRRGVMLFLAGQPGTAIKLFRKSIALVSHDPETHYNLGCALAAVGDLPGAMAAYRKAIELKPDHSQAHQNLGGVLYETGQIPEAMAYCSKAIELKPDYAKAHYLRGLIFGKTRQPTEGIAAFRKAIDAEPQFAYAHFYLGVALGVTGQKPEAMIALRKAIALKLHPDDAADAHYFLGRMLSEAGEIPEAIAALRKALPEDNRRNNVTALLNKLIEQEGKNNTDASKASSYTDDAPPSEAAVTPPLRMRDDLNTAVKKAKAETLARARPRLPATHQLARSNETLRFDT
jgi:tetratricopeptide (TPR) repeat protein